MCCVCVSLSVAKSFQRRTAAASSGQRERRLHPVPVSDRQVRSRFSQDSKTSIKGFRRTFTTHLTVVSRCCVTRRKIGRPKPLSILSEYRGRSLVRLAPSSWVPILAMTCIIHSTEPTQQNLKPSRRTWRKLPVVRWKLQFQQLLPDAVSAGMMLWQALSALSA